MSTRGEGGDDGRSVGRVRAAVQEAHKLGAKVRGLRRKENLSQVQLAERLGISASYLNLIENNKRPLPASVLLKLAQQFELDLQSFGGDDDARLVSDLMECFADPLFESHPLNSADVREFATTNPAIGRATLALYRAYTSAREGADALADKLSAGDLLPGVERTGAPSEEVGDLIQRHMNHFPELEEGAEALWRDAKLDRDELYGGLVRYLEMARGVTVKVARWGDEKGTLRRYDRERKTLVLSELLPTRSRVFQLAHQIALLSHRETIERLLGDYEFASEESRSLARVALANYFAGAVLMPYGAFLSAAREERYDIDVLGRRFRVGFEQACHRLTTLRRPGAEGVPFHFIRIDVAGNISKRFSASGIRFARYSGACPRWNVFSSFMTPGMIRIQLSRMPDGTAFFCIARSIQKDAGGFHAQHPVMAIGLGCPLQHARELVYADGVDLEKADLVVPVGVTCRTCERTNCEQRALPSLKVPLHIDEHSRGLSLYSSGGGGGQGGAKR